MFLRILATFFSWHPKIRERIDFEKKNLADSFAHPFPVPADVAFEFSSEGEFQQVLPLITDGVRAGKRFELIYFSPSVEKGVRELCEKFPENLRALRYPLLTGKVLSWVSAPKLVLVRYDLFPELLNFRGELILLWMTFKKEREKGKGISFLKRRFLSRASRIIYASGVDGETGKGLGFPGPVFDFRIEQIERRRQEREEKFKRVFPEYKTLGFHNYPREKRLILGNVWPSDLLLFQEIPEDYFVLVVPHLLTAEILQRFESHFGDRAMVLNKKGVLCELYADFGKAYVGGGFEVSIHSVLEPLVSGADALSCGPKTFRSTEFDLARDEGKITVVKNAQEFRLWLTGSLETPARSGKLGELTRDYPVHRKAIVSC